MSPLFFTTNQVYILLLLPGVGGLAAASHGSNGNPQSWITVTFLSDRDKENDTHTLSGWFPSSAAFILYSIFSILISI